MKLKMYSLIDAIRYARRPNYLTDIVQLANTTRLRSALGSSSSPTMNYSLPRLRTKFGERAFPHPGPFI